MVNVGDCYSENIVEFRRLSTGPVDMWISVLGKTQALARLGTFG